MAKTKKKPKSKSRQGLIYTLIAIITLTLATAIHEKIHFIYAWLNGWSSESTSSLLTGQTSATILTTSPTISVWVFYMLPPLLIFTVTTAVMILKPDKIILIVGSVFQFLNLASVEPSIAGSDANSAAQFLIQKGWIETSAYGLHYIIFGIVVIIWASVSYISIENNPKDAKSRIKSIIG